MDPITHRIVVPCSTSAGLDSELSQHFGRCPYFAVVEVEAGEITSCRHIENPHGQNHVPGAVPALCVDLGADVLLCGGIGARAIGLFEQAGVAVSSQHSGTLRESIASHLSGDRKRPVPCKHDHPHSCGGES